MSRWVFCGKTHINQNLSIYLPRDAILTPSLDGVIELLKCEEPRCDPQFVDDFIECSVALGSSLFRPAFHYTANGVAMKKDGPGITEPFFSTSNGAVRFYFVLKGIVCRGINSVLKLTVVDALVENNSFRSNMGITSGYKAPRVSGRF